MSLEQWKYSLENAKNHLQLMKQRKADFVAKCKSNISAQTNKEVKNRMKEDFNRQVQQHNYNLEYAKKELERIKSIKPNK
jgi:hypothetical protein